MHKHLDYRPEIDGLRAFAIMSVVLFHAFPSFRRGGFVGVDVFFVISGYLISSIIFKGLEPGDFSFAEFYRRRVRRIFPALLLVLLVCFAVGWFSLMATDLKRLQDQALQGAARQLDKPMASDVTGLFERLNSTEQRIVTRLQAIEDRLKAVEAKLHAPSGHRSSAGRTPDESKAQGAQST